MAPPVDPTPIANPELYDPSTAAFTATGAFATKGSTFYVSGGPDVSALSLLADGKVLISGEPTSEIYDPDTGMFALTSPMTTPCFGGPATPLYISGRTATLLEDGKVLLTGGGEEDCGRFANAELYDALKAKFSPTGSMMRHRDNHAATLLRNGTVLITGGESEDPFGVNGWIFSGTTASAESYDPSTRTFAPLGNMTERRAGHTATVLKDGRVLIAGGYGYAGIGAYLGAFSTAEIYTPNVLVPPVAPDNFQFDSSSVAPGSSYIVNISGSNLTAESFFDIRFRIPGSTLDQVALNWQRGTSTTHVIPVDIATGVWTVTGVRAHQLETDHTGIFSPVSATITVAPLPFVTALQFDRPSVLAGGSYVVNLSGNNLTPQTFFDVRFTAPGSNTSTVALNWQTGLAGSHAVPLSTALGNWTINGVRAHQNEADHTSDFNPVLAAITVVQTPSQ